ncbi:adrenocortical dysplasia protein homolog [Acanthopagrus latus]|uniref:adrenocortical dysplasia protein homolog n=1 Tax=Acanthopagrus latus TaxID=8177 RepID=UPI00187C87F7|nr:adrenocortical dysplasia protein homolog [Acanthopagrus latus]XP_036962085.1 adrenocortical dysplasia protein homolog [Acanthopagrus latus]XP_036962086.1 adrenocortical dysplasia protein homolog [Acanthopagrus latus]XP_036962087.1 adrenocortical dysplasia protein homolog [Acanthopagrus latus]
MPRLARNRLSPWIESLILSYGTQKESSGWLKAHVIGVGPMSQDQAQCTDTAMGPLFLSDGMLQIPAILNASAWEHLQEKEDRESLSSLVNTTVCIKDYQLQFLMAHEHTKCRFFLSVGELATTAAGPVKDNTPCCTTLPSIRQEIFKTWRAMLGQEVQDSQASQCGFDLSELLGEWQHDCMQALLEDVKERLMTVSSRPVSPQPSTSAYTPLSTKVDTSTATSWDVERIAYKRVKCFSVPIRYLLIPEDDTMQLPTPPNVGSSSPSGLPAASGDRERDLPQVSKPSMTTQPSVDHAEWRIAKPAVLVTGHNTNGHPSLLVEDSMLHDFMITGVTDRSIRSSSNPWDMFPPPCDTSSSSNPSPGATPTHSIHNPTAESKPDCVVILTSTQLPVHSSKESQHTSEHSKGEHSYLPPYQKLQHLSSVFTTAGSSTSVTPPESPIRPFNCLPTIDEHCTSTAQKNPLTLDQERQILENDTKEAVEGKCRKAKRKRSEPTPEALTTLLDEEEAKAQISGSPPSWLFDTRAGSKEDSSYKQGQTERTVGKTTPTVHGDGRLFSYSYRVSGQNLQDFSQFKVAKSWLHWAVKCLVVPKQTDNPNSKSGSTNRTSSERTKVTSL